MSEPEDIAFSTGLRDLSERYGLGVSESAMEICLQHFRVLRRWNRVINLIGDLSVESAVFRHYGESLFLASVLDPSFRRIADYGSGAGFPGIGIVALRPDVQVDLLEVRQKRIAFLREATRGVENVHVIGGPAYDYQGVFDAVTARAVDIGQILAFAVRHRVSAGLLIGAADAARWRDRLIGQGTHPEVFPVPWKQQSVVFVIDPV